MQNRRAGGVNSAFRTPHSALTPHLTTHHNKKSPPTCVGGLFGVPESRRGALERDSHAKVEAVQVTDGLALPIAVEVAEVDARAVGRVGQRIGRVDRVEE